MNPRKKSGNPDWSELLVQAVQTPGTLSTAYQRFWNYSVGNQLLAMFECMLRGIHPGPIHTFKGWLKLGRHVKKGEKAISLCMPVTVKQTSKDPPPKDESNPSINSLPNDPAMVKRTIFIFRPRWFVLDQTDGDPYVPTEVPAWSENVALAALGIERIPFDLMNGNCQGFARGRSVSVSPIAVLPHKTLFHEIAHVVLGHTQELSLEDAERTPMHLREAEAECVALICCEALDLPGSAECRGYLQHWLAGRAIPCQSAQHIFKAADAMLRAGRTSTSDNAVGEDD